MGAIKLNSKSIALSRRLDRKLRQEIRIMNPIISREDDLEVVRLILKVKDKLKELNDALCRIPGPDPNLPMSEYGRGAPFDYHLKFHCGRQSFQIARKQTT